MSKRPWWMRCSRRGSQRMSISLPHAEAVGGYPQVGELRDEVVLPRQEIGGLVLERVTVAGGRVLDEQPLGPPGAESLREPEDPYPARRRHKGSERGPSGAPSASAGFATTASRVATRSAKRGSVMGENGTRHAGRAEVGAARSTAWIVGTESVRLLSGGRDLSGRGTRRPRSRSSTRRRASGPRPAMASAHWRVRRPQR